MTPERDAPSETRASGGAGPSSPGEAEGPAGPPSAGDAKARVGATGPAVPDPPTGGPAGWLHRLRRGKEVAWHAVRRELSDRPALFFPVIRLQNLYLRLSGADHRKHPVTRDTELVVEGFPRSANSFAVGALQAAQPRRLRIAHHIHAPAQVMRGCRLGLPVLVLVRDPVGAVISHRALVLQGSAREGRPRPSLAVGHEAWLKTWIRFHGSLLPYRDGFLVATFEEVTEDLAAVIRRINARFGTELVPFRHTPERARAVNEARGYHAGPSAERERFKERARADWERAREREGGLDALEAEARRLHDRYRRLARRQRRRLDGETP